MKLAGPALFLALLPAPALAGPFGIDLASFDPHAKTCEPIQDGYYTCTVPEPQPQFETYVVYYVDKIGLCMVKGVSANIVDQPQGQMTKAQTDIAAAKLIASYGPWTDKADSMAEEGAKDDPEAWMQDLSDQKRVYLYYWLLDAPKDGISEVYVAAQATTAQVGYYSVEYYTPAADACDAASAQ